ncbi:MAG: GTPase [Candidatus Thermoplasmatota archaeon]
MWTIPTILTADEVLDKAFKRAAKITSHKGIALSAAKMRRAAGTIDALFARYLRAFPSLDDLHPFHRELVDLLVGVDRLKHALGAMDWCRKQVMRVAKEEKRGLRAAYGRISSVVKRIEGELCILAEARRRIKNVPEIDPGSWSVIVAGAPNVGKSQLVAALSSARPKIAHYPFTTTGIHVGHTEVGYSRVQVIDTPGLLDRPMEERNECERQAVLALRHLQGIVIYLFDPSETCGYPLDYQERVRAGVAEVFEGKRVIEVDNKADLVERGSDRMRISALSGEGIAELQEIVKSALAL